MKKGLEKNRRNGDCEKWISYCYLFCFYFDSLIILPCSVARYTSYNKPHTYISLTPPPQHTFQAHLPCP